jgi:hypothetical protein
MREQEMDRISQAITVIGSPIPHGKIRATCTRCGEQFLADSLSESRLLMDAHKPCEGTE